MVGNEQTPLLREDPIQEYHEGGNLDSQRPTSRLIIYGSFMGVFLAAADESFLLSTWSMIASEFNSLSWGSWLLVTYNLGYCISLPVYGVLCGSFGRRKVLLGAYALYAAGCLVCGTSTSYTQLVLGRFMAGMSGGGMVSLVSIIITDIAPPEDVAVLRGYANVINASARSLGAPLGGLLIDSIGWRWSFFGHVPLVALCILITTYGIPSDSNAKENHSEPDSDQRDASVSNASGFDFGGLVSFFIAMVLFFATLQDLGSTTHSWRLTILVPTTVVAILIFIVIEAYWAKRPLISLALFRTSIGAYLTNQTMMTACHSALLSNLVPYLIRLQNTTNLFATSAFIVAATGVSGGSLLAGAVIKRSKRYKLLTVIAVCGLAFGFFVMLIRWRIGFSPWELAYLFPSGVCLGVLFVTQFTAMSLAVPKEQLAVCITTYYFFQQLGWILGPATSVAIVQHAFEGGLKKALRGLPEEKLINRIVNDERFAWTLNPDAQSLIQWSYRNAFQFAPLISMVCSLVMLPSVTWLKEKEIN